MKNRNKIIVLASAILCTMLIGIHFCRYNQWIYFIADIVAWLLAVRLLRLASAKNAIMICADVLMVLSMHVYVIADNDIFAIANAGNWVLVFFLCRICVNKDKHVALLMEFVMGFAFINLVRESFFNGEDVFWQYPVAAGWIIFSVVRYGLLPLSMERVPYNNRYTRKAFILLFMLGVIHTASAQGKKASQTKELPYVYRVMSKDLNVILNKETQVQHIEAIIDGKVTKIYFRGVIDSVFIDNKLNYKR